MSMMLRPGHKIQLREFAVLEKKNINRAISLLWTNKMMVMFTVFVAAVALAFPISLVILARNVQHLAGNWERDLQVQLFLTSGITKTQREKLIEQVQAHDFVQSLELVDAAAGLAEFSHEAGLDELIQTLGYNPLPDVLLLKPTAQEPVILQKLLEDMASLPSVDSVDFDQRWAQLIGSFFQLVNFFTALVLQLLLVGLFMLIAGNVNALVARSSHEIRVIKLIGATDGFVSRQYIYFGGMIGLLGGVCAFALVVFMMVKVSDLVDNLLSSYDLTYQLQRPAWWELLFLLFAPMLLGMFAAVMSCRSAISQAMPNF